MVYLYLSEQLLTTQLILHKTPDTPSLFKKKIVLSIADAFRNIHFLPHLYQFSQCIRCAIFQINTNLLIIQQNINIFTQVTLHHLFKKNCVLHHRIFWDPLLFNHIFTKWMRCAIYQIKINLLVISQNISIFIQETL